MDMQDTKEILGKYWPWLVGGIAGIYLISRYSGGGGGGGDYAALMAQQSQAAQQNAALSLQARQMEGQIAVAMSQAEAARTAAAGQAAGQAAVGAANLISALNAPMVTAINAASADNKHTMETAALTTAAGFMSRGQMVTATAQQSAAWAEAMGKQAQAMGMSVQGSQIAIGTQSQALAQMNASTQQASASKFGVLGDLVSQGMWLF